MARTRLKRRNGASILRSMMSCMMNRVNVRINWIHRVLRV